MKPILILISYFLLLTSFSFSQTTQWRLIWDKNFEEDMSHYEIFRSNKNDADSLITTVDHIPRSGDDTTMTFPDGESIPLSQGVLYYYRLKAVNLSGLKSEFSDEESAAIPQILIPDTVYIYKNEEPKAIPLDATAVNDPDHDPSEITWTWDESADHQLILEVRNDTLFVSRKDTSWFDEERRTLTATDPDGFYDEKTVLFIVLNIENLHPIVSGIPDQTIKAGQNFSPINLDDYVTDPDNNNDEMNWSYSGNIQLAVNISAGRVATITPPNSNWTGTESIIFTATDPGGLSDSDMASFTIEPDTIPVLSELIVYPIPFRPVEDGVTNITFKNVPVNSKILVYDFFGNPVFSVTAPANTYLWDVRNQSGRKIRSGVYPYIVKDGSGKKIHSGKLIVVR